MADIDEESATRESFAMVRDLHLGQLKQLHKEIEDQNTFAEFNEGDLTVRAEQLRHHFQQMEAAHLMYRQCTMLSTNAVYIKAQRKYLQSLAKVEGRIKELTRVENSQFQPSLASTLAASEQTVYRLDSSRRPQIGKFNGNPADWPGFRDVFLAEVDRKGYEPVTKLIYLREACTGRAERILGTWQLTAANYALAWESMMHAFNDDYQMVHGILDEMYQAQPAEQESTDDMQEILNVLNNSVRQLKSMTTRKVLEEQLFIHYATWRMAPATRDAWEQYRNREKVGGLPSLDDMKQFLHYKTRVHIQPSRSNVAPKTSTDKGKRSTHNGTSADTSRNQRFKPYDRTKSSSGTPRPDKPGFGPPPDCLMTGCGQTHYLGLCPKFQQVKFSDRMEIVKEHNLCRCCLMVDHTARDCGRRGCAKCPDAKSKHHYFLCMKTHQDGPMKKEATKPSRAPQ